MYFHIEVRKTRYIDLLNIPMNRITLNWYTQHHAGIRVYVCTIFTIFSNTDLKMCSPEFSVTTKSIQTTILWTCTLVININKMFFMCWLQAATNARRKPSASFVQSVSGKRTKSLYNGQENVQFSSVRQRLCNKKIAENFYIFYNTKIHLYKSIYAKYKVQKYVHEYTKI